MVVHVSLSSELRTFVTRFLQRATREVQSPLGLIQKTLLRIWWSRSAHASNNSSNKGKVYKVQSMLCKVRNKNSSCCPSSQFSLTWTQLSQIEEDLSWTMVPLWQTRNLVRTQIINIRITQDAVTKKIKTLKSRHQMIAAFRANLLQIVLTRLSISRLKSSNSSLRMSTKLHLLIPLTNSCKN